MSDKILLITPPFTQLNTPYPASPYLKGFLKLHGYDVFQADLGIELINDIFSRPGFQRLFDFVKKNNGKLSPNSVRIMNNEQVYLQTVDRVMDYLQYRERTLARLLCSDHYLPRASRFDHLPVLEWSFGSIGVNDRSRFLATRYIEDIGDLIKDAVTPYFGFTRYAEKLGMSAHSFSDLDYALHQPENIIEMSMLSLLKEHIERQRPNVVGITIPFPGNVYAALKCAQYIKKHHGNIVVIAGGGFVNTELRELSDSLIFDYVDFITLDDGERPFLHILKYLQDSHSGHLKRTFVRAGDRVQYKDEGSEPDFPHTDIGCPDYSDLPLDRYLSLIEIANPMHRLWSDGQWNKLTIAHGCYWHRCSFCDTDLDYIKRFDSAPARVLVDRIEQLISQTGQRGFHFVDEASPPTALKELALELLRRKIDISWWVNVRFEQAFTADLCRLLAASGCIAATGGLETASDRLLKLMNKGITVRQAAQVCRNMSDAGILVHAYLMYGFPTQTEQETIDSLETVRQFFHEGLIQSAFWHAFTATVHSDVGKNPSKYKCRVVNRPSGGFALNDLVHEDPLGCGHSRFAPGLNKAVYNFMYGVGTDFPIKEWFDFRVPKVSLKNSYVEQAIREKSDGDQGRSKARILWTGNRPQFIRGNSEKQGKGPEKSRFVFYDRTETFTLTINTAIGDWLNALFDRFLIRDRDLMTIEELRRDYEEHVSGSFASFLRSHEWQKLREKGLLVI